MSRALRAGDRVRVTARNRLAGYVPGDKGTVLRDPSAATVTGECYYTVGWTGTGRTPPASCSPSTRSSRTSEPDEDEIA